MNEINEKVSESHRKQPNKRWMGSYTQRIVEGLQKWQIGRAKFQTRYRLLSKPIDEALDRAVNLLRDYHETMHVVYEERDQARVRVEQLECVKDVQQAEIDELGDSLKTATEKLNSAKNAVRFPGSYSEWERVQKERDEAREQKKALELDVISARAHAERLLQEKNRLEWDRGQVAKAMNEYREMFLEYREMFLQKCKLLDEAKAATTYAETELRTCKQHLTEARAAYKGMQGNYDNVLAQLNARETDLRACKGQLVDSQKFGDNFKRLLKSNLREALEKSGAL